VVQTLLLGVAGFLLMLASAWYGLRSGRSGPAAPAEQGPGSTAGPKGAAASPKRAGFMDRLEERWERRRDGDDS
jgi:hypothetical protein